jgi:DNA-binding MarR family transcriptional regulator
MPRKNTNARPHRRATTALRALPDPDPTHAGRTAAEDKLWAALRAHPDTTTTDLATHAGIGRSTAGKILTTWERDGAATRTPAPASKGTRRAPDTWTTTDGNDQANTKNAADTPQPDSQSDSDDDNEASTGGAGGTAPATPEPVEGADPATENTTAPTTRLGKGALRGLVEDYLTEHPDTQFSPSAIGKALGRSSGAVANALDRLVTDGYAIQTQDKPKRYSTATPTEPATR